MINKIHPIQNPSLELGIVSSAVVQLDAKNGEVDYSSGLWPFEQEVQLIGTGSVRYKYKEFIQNIIRLIDTTSVSKIITVGMEALLNDLISKQTAGKLKIMIPNTTDVDIERIIMNYEDSDSIVLNPYQALGYVGANTLVIVPVFKLNDDTIYMYNYARRFMGSDVSQYSFCCVGLELLPSIKSMDYRTSPYSPELRDLSHIEGKYFHKIFTF